VLVTQDGNRLEGVIRNEDNFSVQLQTKDGGFHFFQKSNLRAVEHLERSLMPTDYSERLSASELNDLVSYLMNSGSTTSKAAQDPSRTEDPTE
jgi:putative heme-binding domain-containing protein